MNATLPHIMMKPPLADGLPLVGSAYNIYNNPAQFLVEQYQKHGAVFRMNIMNQRITVLAGLEANQFLSRQANEYLVTDEIWGGFPKAVKARPEHFLMSIDGARHAKYRRVFMRGYSPQMIRGRFPKVLSITEEMVKANSGEWVSVLEFIRRMVTEQLGELLCNKAPGHYFDDLAWFIRTVLNVTVMKSWPKLMLKHPKFVKAQKNLELFAREIIEEHRQANETETPDLIDDILAAVDKEPDLFVGPELFLAVTGPFFAGMDTVTNTLASTIYRLAKHRDILKLAQEEVDAVFANGMPDVSSLRKMPVIHGIMMETLRIHPVAPMIPRTVGKAFEFNGYKLEKGQHIYMANGVTHFLPELFPNPHKFDINRYKAPRNEHKQKGAFSPFGLGAHKCLGNRLGEIQMMLTLVALVRFTDFELVSLDYELDMQTIPTIGPHPKFKVRLAPRNK